MRSSWVARLALFLLGLGLAPAEAGDSLARVQTRMVSAMGGEAAWSQVPALKLTGVRNRNGYEMGLVAWLAREQKMRVELTLRGQREVFLHDGERAWLKGFRDEGFSALDAAEAWEHLEEAEKYLRWPQVWLRYEEARVEEETGHGQAAADRLVLVSPQGEAETWIVAREDGRVREIVETRTGNDGESYEVHSYAFDYREVEGLVLPHYVEIDHGTSLYSFTIDTIEVVPSPPADHFRPAVSGQEDD
jgi:hypothetical protein